MNRPKVLIHIRGGVADYAVLGDVEIAYVDEDMLHPERWGIEA